MFHRFEPSGSVQGLWQLVREGLARGCGGLQVLGTVDNGWTSEDIAEVGAFAGVPLFGALFPRLIHEQVAHTRGAIVIGHAERPVVKVLRPSDAPGPAGVRWPLTMADARTVIAWVDATCDTSRFAAMLFEELGAGPSFIGGGAGSMDLVRRPVILSNDGLHEAACVLAAFAAPASIGVKHGWRTIGEPLVVTGANGSTVTGLDWRPARDAYHAVVEQHAGVPLTPEGLEALAPKYPLVLERLGSEGVVRDPIVLGPDASLRCAGTVPAHATVRIATATPADMVAASGAARAVACALAEGPPELALTIVCISRGLLLGDGLAAELDALKVPGVPQVGALTVGELAGSGEEYLDFHNKTVALALLSEVRGGP